MGCLSDTSKVCTALVLIALNGLLLAGGIVILYGSLHAKNTGWMDVIESNWSSTDTLVTVLQATGYAIIALSVLGSVAACLRWRLGLLLYAFVVSIIMIAFIVVAIIAVSARNTSQNWENKDFPAADGEETVKEQFDSAYCYAQGAYICNDITVQSAAQIFYPDYANSSLLSAFTDLKGVNSMCNAFSTLVPTIATVCKGCQEAKQFENFTAVLDWANDKCPRTDKTLLWCGTFLATGNGSSVTVGTAPYEQCRSEFLGLVSTTTLTLGVGSVLICVGALLVVVFSCYLRSKERRGQQYENVEYGDAPSTAQQQNGTPQTQQPFYGGQPTQKV